MRLTFRCPQCGRRYPPETRAWQCECGGAFQIEERPPFSPDTIDQRDNTLWRYRQMIPLPEGADPASLGEGFTPVIPLEVEPVGAVLAKLEFLSATGSYKDRGTTVLVSALANWGIDRVIEDSSGNAAASLAAYCARVRIPTRIFVPAYASGMKVSQVRAYGAELIPVDGPREKATEAAMDEVRRSHGYYASHALNPLGLEGIKTFAYELWEQLDGSVPKGIVFPTGHGTFLLGTYLGFQDLVKAGLSHDVPRLVAVQPERCAPLYHAHRSGADEIAAVGPSRETIAEGIRVTRPGRGRELLRAIRDTGGQVLTVTEEQILRSQSALAEQGLYVEPTSAAAVAGLDGLAPIDGTWVVPLTATGLKGAPSRSP